MFLCHLVRHVESIHIEQVVQHPDVIALESIELEFDYQERSECSEALVFKNITLGYLLNQGCSKVHGLRFVVRVFGEAKPLVDIELRQVDDDGAVGRRNVGHVDHPTTLDRNRKGSGEIWRVYNASRSCQVTATEWVKVHDDTWQVDTEETQKEKTA